MSREKGSTTIGSGKWKRTKIDFQASPGVRPTLSRHRKTMFDWLMHDLNNSTCLDLFAGSGILGLECLSRNAKKVVFVDKNPMLIKSIHRHLINLKADAESYHLVSDDFMLALKELKAYKFDIIFIDPPYQKIAIIDVLNALLKFDLIFPATSIIFEGKVVDLNQIGIMFDIMRIKTIKSASYGLLKVISPLEKQ